MYNILFSINTAILVTNLALLLNIKKFRSAEKREKFSIAKFALKYNLGNPVAGNFYQAQYDDYVPLLYKQLGA